MTDRFDQVFATVPVDIRRRMRKHYLEIQRYYVLNMYEPSELNGAKFCEDVYRLLEWHTSASNDFTPYGTHIQNFKGKVRKFESDSSLDDSIRFHIPDILASIFNIRNKRGVGHTPGNVDPNFMDATLVRSSVDWVVAELVRLLHKLSPHVSLKEAREMVQELSTKNIPLIWEVDGFKRVLSPSSGTLLAKDKVLVLLYSESTNKQTVEVLRESIEYKNLTRFKSKVLTPLHQSELIFFNKDTNEVTLSPKGILRVENDIDLEL